MVRLTRSGMLWGAGFALSLYFNTAGVFSSVSKEPLPGLLYENETAARNVAAVLVKLRDATYKELYATGTDNFIVSTYQTVWGRPVKHNEVSFLLEGKPAHAPRDRLEDVRGALLLHPYDESNLLSALSQIKPAKGQWNPHLFIYGGVFIYSVGAVLETLRRGGLLHLTPDPTFYLIHPREMGHLIGSIELFVGLVAALGIFPLFWLAEKWKGRVTALWACLFYPLVPVFSMLSHRMKPHAFSFPFLLFAYLFIYRAACETPKRTLFFGAGLAIGLAIGTIYTSAFLVPALVLAYFLNPNRRNAERGIWPLALLGTTLAFLGTNPYYALTPAEPLEELITLLTRHIQTATFGSKAVLFVLYEIPKGLGWPLWLLALGGSGSRFGRSAGKIF